MSKADSQLMHMMCSHLGKETKANLVERLLKEFILDLEDWEKINFTLNYNLNIITETN